MEYIVHIGQVAEQAGLLLVELCGVVLSGHAKSTHVELADRPTSPNDVLRHGEAPGQSICWMLKYVIYVVGMLPLAQEQRQL